MFNNNKKDRVYRIEIPWLLEYSKYMADEGRKQYCFT
jgi:hypothetical protein